MRAVHEFVDALVLVAGRDTFARNVQRSPIPPVYLHIEPIDFVAAGRYRDLVRHGLVVGVCRACPVA